jgi:hypothetical protein
MAELAPFAPALAAVVAGLALSFRAKAGAALIASVLAGALAVVLARGAGASLPGAFGAAIAHALLLQLAYVAGVAARAFLHRGRRE